MKDDATTADRATKVNEINPVHNAARGFGALASGSQQAFAGWVRSNEAIVKGTFDLAQQMLTFGQTRLTDDLVALRDLLSCHDLGEVARCQRQFAEKAAAEYRDQANKVTGTLTNLFAGATASVTHPAEPGAR